MAERLTGDDRPVEVDGVLLRAPELVGEVTVERPGTRGAGRGGRRGNPRDEAETAIDRALRRQQMRSPKTIRVDRPADEPTRSRGGDVTPPPMTLTVRGPRPGREQAVLSIDEHGIATWHFAEAPKRGARAATAPGARTYSIPRIASPEAAAGDRRFPGVGKIIKVVTFPIAKVVGRVARFAVREWDQERHPPRIRRFGADGSLTKLDDAAWNKLASGRTLLFIHGTFSTTEGAFGMLPNVTLDELHERYGGRVIAYDHPTIADDPMANARTFLEQVGDRPLDVDIVCHSRGGLVTRSITERPGDLAGLAPNVRVGMAVLVAATANGTILASADYWNELVDRATTLLSFLPVPVAVDALETVFGLVRSIAVQTAKDLEGLDAMVPDGDFLKLLNKQPARGPFKYRAIVSNFEPRDPGLAAWLNDKSRDWIFQDQPNDMMVSIDSMTGTGLKGGFPITVSAAFAPADGIEHSDYFGQERTSKALLEWLTAQP